jgi:hypothetical protein
MVGKNRARWRSRADQAARGDATAFHRFAG